MPLELAEELWGQLGFPHTADDDVAFTKNDVEALKHDRRAGLARASSSPTRRPRWSAPGAAASRGSRSGRPSLLGGLALADDHPERAARASWSRRSRRGSGSCRTTSGGDTSSAPRSGCCHTVEADDAGQRMAVAFTDIVGYTSQSKNLTEAELVDLVETFEDETTRAVTAIGGPGDQDHRRRGPLRRRLAPGAGRGRAGAHRRRARTTRTPSRGSAPASRTATSPRRLGDVFGPTVNIASRLTSIARPGTVLVDRGAFDALTGRATSRPGHRRPTAPRSPSCSTGPPRSSPTSRRTPSTRT